MSAHDGMWGRRAVTAVTTLALLSGGGVTPALAATLGIDEAPISAQAVAQVTLSTSNTKVSLPVSEYTSEVLEPEVFCSDPALAQARNLDLNTEYTVEVTKFTSADGEEVSTKEIKDAGTYELKVTGKNDFKGSFTTEVTLAKREVSLVSLKFEDTVYFGKKWTDSWPTYEDPEFSNLATDEDGNVIDTPGINLTDWELDDKNAGENKVVTFEWELDEESAKNYTASSSQGTSYITIEPYELDIAWDEVGPFEFNGKEQAPTTTFDKKSLPSDLQKDDIQVTVEGAQTDVGKDYVAKVTLTGADAANYVLPEDIEDQKFDIVEGLAEVVKEPKAAQALAADGTAHELVVAGSAKGGVMKYAIGKSTSDVPADTYFSEKIPTGTDAGDYVVFWKVFGDKNHADNPEPAQYIEVTIQDRSLIKTEVKGIDGLVYNGEDQILIKEGEAANKGDKIVYALADNPPTDPADWSWDYHEAMGLDAGTYRVWYTVKTKKDGVQQDLAAYVDVEIAKKDVTITLSGAKRPYNGTNVVTDDIIAAADNTKNVKIEGLLEDDEGTVKLNLKDPSFKAFTEDKNAGENKSVKVDFATISGNGNYKLADGALTATITIEPAQVWVTGIEAEDKAYDGTTDATIKASKTYKTNLDDVKKQYKETEKDDVAVDLENSKGTFENANAGKDKVVNLEIAFKGADAANYAIDKRASQTTAKATITAGSFENAEIKLSDTIYTYDGNAKTPAVLVTIDGKVVATTDYTVEYANNVEIGTATVTVKGSDNLPGTKTATFQIVKGRKFIDVNDATPHHNDIDWLAATGISEGWDNGDGTYSFKPMASNARADMAAFMFRLAVNEGIVSSDWQPENYDAFVDVDESTPHAREIAWLASVGVSKGWADGTFRPYQTIARCDMAAFLHRFAALSGRGAGVQGKSFSDVTSSTPHAEDIEWLGGSGISIGFPDGTFRALNDVVRQDMAAFLHRLDNLA